MREVPDLAPSDSLSRFAQRLRYHATTALPVVKEGYIQGIAHQSDLIKVLGIGTKAEREAALQRPVREIMTPVTAYAMTDTPLSEVRSMFAEQGVGMIPILEPDGYCLGMILANDLLAPASVTPRPSLIGGMATPFGVYLTDGNLQAGASNGALVASGFLLGCFFVITLWVSEAFLNWGQTFGLPRSLSADLDITFAVQSPTLGLMNVGVRLFSLGVLLVLMRLNRLAGYHAAEHQTVHAIERSETLTPLVVGRMPRAHPRCGTNIMAGATLFFTLLQVALCLPYGDTLAPLVALFGTVFYWRKVGAFLQERFTTRTASEKELMSGIRAGEELLHKYLQSTPSRPRLWRRIWCMGMVQNLVGVSLALWLGQWLHPFLVRFLHL
jgi:CBS domain-containing protein